MGLCIVRGWSIDKNSENYKVRQDMIKFSDLDITGISQTHLMNKDDLSVHGYVRRSQNRKYIHVNARIGCGGVRFLIKRSVLNQFDIHDIDEYDGIYWIKLSAKRSECVMLVCVCYLPPIDSCIYVNGADFMDNLLG